MTSKLLKKRNPKNKSKKHKSSNLSNKMIKKIGIKQSKKSSLKRKRKYKSHKRLNVKTGGVLPEDGPPPNTPPPRPSAQKPTITSQRHTNPLPPPIPPKSSAQKPLPQRPLKTPEVKRMQNNIKEQTRLSSLHEQLYNKPTTIRTNNLYKATTPTDGNEIVTEFGKVFPNSENQIKKSQKQKPEHVYAVPNRAFATQPNPPQNQSHYSLVNEPQNQSDYFSVNVPPPNQLNANEEPYNQLNPPVNNIYNTINEPPTNEKPYNQPNPP